MPIAHRGSAPFNNVAWHEIFEELSGNTTADTTAAIASLSFYACIRGASAPSMSFLRSASNAAITVGVGYRPVGGSLIGRTVSEIIDTFSSRTLAANSTNADTGSITTTGNDRLLVAAAAVADATETTLFDAATGATTDSGAGTDVANHPTSNTWKRRGANATASGSDVGVGIADAIMTTAGPTGTVQCAAGDDSRHAMAVIAFKHPLSFKRRSNLLLLGAG